MQDVASWIFLILGLLGGLGFSVIFWWITNHKIVPDLQFSEEVSWAEVGFYPSGIRHQIAIKNCGKRDAYNVKFRVRLGIKDILHSGGKIWDYIDLDLASNEFFILKKGIMFRITPVAHRTKAFSSDLYPPEIREKFETGQLSLDDIFKEYDNVKLFIEAIATDRFSGGAKYFRSKEYTKRDIRKGVFWGNDHMAIHQQKKRAVQNKKLS